MVTTRHETNLLGARGRRDLIEEAGRIAAGDRVLFPNQQVERMGLGELAAFSVQGGMVLLMTPRKNRRRVDVQAQRTRPRAARLRN